MNILAIVGSPRKDGNTDILVRKVLKGTVGSGISTEIIYLNDLKISSCQGCDYCKKNGRCRQKDDMQIIYSKLHEADGIVIGSPIYMAGVTAQTKLMLDRMHAFIDSNFKSQLPAGKRAVVITAQGAEDPEEYRSAIRMLTECLEWFGIKIIGILVGAGLGPAGAVANRNDLLNKAFKLGIKLTRKPK